MSTMRQRDEVIAVLCSDIHLSTKPPRARRTEKDWFAAMADTLRQLQVVADRYEAPILCAGDLFDHWRVDPELINFALMHLPEMYAIPGQHDLPLHNIEMIKRSAYWTMVLAGRVSHVDTKVPLTIENNIVLHGYPWGEKLKPQPRESRKFHVAICHDYFWTGENCYHGVSESSEASRFAKLVKGYHAVAFGDNHKGFQTKVGGVPVMNCGGFMRRTSDQENYEPRVGLLCASGAILEHKFKTSHEKFTTLEQEEEGLRKILRANDLGDFLVGLTQLQQKSFDFMEAIEYAMREKMVTNKVRRLIVEALERE